MDQWKLVNIYIPIIMYIVNFYGFFLNFQRKLKFSKNKWSTLYILLMHVIEY